MSPEWKYRITLNISNWDAAQAWCEENIGKFDDTWYKLGIDPIEYVVEGQARSVWYFKNENDATMFALRWA